MMTPGSLLPTICLISSRADLTLKSQCVMPSAPADEIDTQFNNALFSTFATLIVSRGIRPMPCVVAATGCSHSVVFPEILLGTCCSATHVCASLTSRGSSSRRVLHQNFGQGTRHHLPSSNLVSPSSMSSSCVSPIYPISFMSLFALNALSHTYWRSQYARRSGLV